MTTRDTPETLTADLVVIGFGKGGKTLAATLGRQGWRVIMIEQSALMYGGTCINIGCVPTKSMVYRAEHLDLLTESAGRAYEAAVHATQALTSDLRAANFAMLDRLDAVTVLTGHARFLDASTVHVAAPDGTATIVTARHIVIGTGSHPVLPDITGLRASARTVTSTELLTLPTLPARLVVLGGGYVGLEFAAAYANYGSQVTVIERSPQILSHEDGDVAAGVGEILDAAGVTVITAAEVSRIDDHPDAGASVFYRDADAQQWAVEADTILVALGRTPVTAGLDLDKAGVAVRTDGSIAVDEHLRTSQPHIFAVGDVNGGPQFTYVSLDDYRIVLAQLTASGSRSTADRQAVPYVLFTTPPLARVGLTEHQAQQQGYAIRTATMRVIDMATVPRARIVEESAGLMKVVVDAATDQILGAALLSYDSHEVINLVAIAIRYGITATQLRDEIYTHPSMTEAFNQLLGALS